MSYFDPKSMQIVKEEGDFEPVHVARRIINSIIYGNPEGSIYDNRKDKKEWEKDEYYRDEAYKANTD